MAEHDAICMILDDYDISRVSDAWKTKLRAARAQLDALLAENSKQRGQIKYWTHQHERVDQQRRALLARQAKLEAALREIAKGADIYDGPLTPEEGIIKSLKGLAAKALAEDSAKE